MNRKDIVHLSGNTGFLYFLFFSTAAFLIFRSTFIVPGLSPDSALYLSLADSIRSGYGYVDYHQTPVVVYPPLYASVIAFVGLIFSDIQFSARLVNASLFAINVVLTMKLIRIVTGARILELTGGIMMLCSADLIGIHTMVWSETIFISSALLFLISIIQYASTGADRYFWMAVFAAAAGSMSRYAGVSLIAAGCLIIVSINIRSYQSYKKAFIFGLVSCIPAVVWFLRNVMVVGRPYVGTGPSTAMFSYTNLKLALVIIRSWTGSPPWIYAMILGSSFFAFLASKRIDVRETENVSSVRPNSFRWVMILILTYVAVVAGSVYRYGLNFPADQRFLAPIYAPLIMIGLFLLFELIGRFVDFSRLKSRSAGALLIGLGIILVLIFVKDLFSSAPGRSIRFYVAASTAIGFAIFGICMIRSNSSALRRWARPIFVVSSIVFAGFSAYSAFMNSDPGIVRGYRPADAVPVTQILKRNEIKGVLYTNADDMIYLLTGRACRRLPVLYDHFGKRVRVRDYDSRFAEFRRKFKQEDAVLYLVNSNKTFLLSTKDLERLGLQVSDESSGMSLYTLP